MNVSDQLLDKYFKNKCTPEEKLRVEKYLREIDELPDHLLKKEEWDDAGDFPMSYAESDTMFEAIKKQTFQKKHKHLWSTVSSIAAAVLVIMGITFYFIDKRDVKQQTSKISAVSRVKQIKISSKSIVNYTNQIQAFTLPDQSVIKIYPGAELRYALPFVARKREIYLVGKSYFKVTKDKQHPFVVYANGVSTTALGTSFTITADAKNSMIQVQLHTGKVWVKNIDSTSKDSKFSEILQPGDQLAFNHAAHSLHIEKRDPAFGKAAVIKELSFTQAPLHQVFSKLAKHYETKILYTPADLEEMSFTGTLNLNQPLNQLLKEITELNKLKQEKIAEGYLIQK